MADWLENPDSLAPPECYAHGLAYAGKLTLLYADPKAGKSTVSVSVGAAVSEGRPWLSHPATEGPVLYLAAEGEPLERWAGQLRERVFGASDPPFPDMEAAEREWVDLARSLIREAALGPVQEGQLPGGEEGAELTRHLAVLRRLKRRIEAEHGVSVADPVLETETLELPRDEDWPGEVPDAPPERLDRLLEARVPVRDPRSQHFHVARAVRRMAEFGGHRKGALTRFVLTGEEPEIPSATVRVERAFMPGPSGDGADWDPDSYHRYVVLRLNEPPTSERLRQIRNQIERHWQSRREAERQALLKLVERRLTPEQRRRARREDWEPVAREWNRSREDGPGWRALQMRYHKHFIEEE